MLLVSTSILPISVKAQGSRGLDNHTEIGGHQEQDKLSSRLVSQFKEQENVTFLVKFKQKADTDKAVQEVERNAENNTLTTYDIQARQHAAAVTELKETALREQQDVLAYLEKAEKSGQVENFQTYFIVNGIAVTGSKEVAKDIAAYPEVEKVLPNEERELFPTSVTDETVKKPEANLDQIEWNIEKVKAPQVWDKGINGQGAVIASIDTGVQWDHPALKEKYRGYDSETGEMNHSYSWFDATAEATEPMDDEGHGTHTVGTVVGSEPDNTEQIGVAPGASWIAVKAFKDGKATDEDLLAAAEWILAPTDEAGNTRLDQAPDVVNNSWGGGPGLDEWYRDVVREWRHANIFPVFAAGNVDSDNPGGPESVASPANYPESFAVGATDIVDKVASFSLRGPSPYDEIKPDVVAPGQVIRSSIPGDGYAENSGTSMAAPAVAGVAGLMRSVDKTISPDQLEDILTSTAIPLTDEEYEDSPNNGYGYGLVDALNAVLSIELGVGSLEGNVKNEDGEALQANITLKGQDRTVSTDPADGSYTLRYAAGEYQVAAKAYGYYEDEQTITLEDGETKIKDFTLEAIPERTIHGQITDDVTGEVIEGATLSLKEDANVDPVSSNENGQYELTSFEGNYTLKVTARGYEKAEVDIEIDEDTSEFNLSLSPFYSYPGDELAYDDGTGEGGSWFHEAGSGWGVRMSLPEGKDRAMVTGGKFLFSSGGGDHFQVEVFDASGPGGAPGKKIAGPIDATAIKDGDWTTVDLRDEGLVVEDDFYMVYMQTEDGDNAPKLQQDKNGEFTERSWENYHGNWYQLESNFLTGNKMIRALVDYEVDQPMITTPTDGEITNEQDVVVEGTATPNTTIQLLNNDEEIKETNVNEDGQFTTEVSLDQGENNLIAVSLVDGAYSGESEPVTITLANQAPELTIDTPNNDEKLRSDVVTVEGKVEADHLDYVEVNGIKAEVNGSSYSKRIILDEGENTIEVIAEDQAGNKTTEQITVQVKTSTPKIEQLTPQEDIYIETGESVAIEFESEPGLDAVFRIHMPLTSTFGIMNTTELPFMEVEDGRYVGYWTATDVTMEGAVLEVKVTDEFGNETYKKADGRLFVNSEGE
ncbi:S8 family serine peptidase [Virgibacillus sp. MSJ-26]|nr:S8 family serine peptidase [Virgibacillus sp. MSJ-26]